MRGFAGFDADSVPFVTAPYSPYFEDGDGDDFLTELGVREGLRGRDELKASVISEDVRNPLVETLWREPNVTTPLVDAPLRDTPLKGPSGALSFEEALGESLDTDLETFSPPRPERRAGRLLPREHARAHVAFGFGGTVTVVFPTRVRSFHLAEVLPLSHKPFPAPLLTCPETPLPDVADDTSVSAFTLYSSSNK